jgi:hypothetical protein
LKLIIDRFEEEFAVCETETREMINIERRKLPPDVLEGMVINLDGDNVKIDWEETDRLRGENKQINMWE